MKSKIIAAAILSVLVLSCKSKVAVSATKPDIVQVPPQVPAAQDPKVTAATRAGVQKTIAGMDPNTTVASITEGKTAYENNCAKCHRLFAATEYTKEEWAPILVSMQKKARLDDAQMAPINNYIYSIAK